MKGALAEFEDTMKGASSLEPSRVISEEQGIELISCFLDQCLHASALGFLKTSQKIRPFPMK